MSKGRILFLHGYTQNADIFYAKTSVLRKQLQKLGYTPVYLNAPLKLTPSMFPSTDALSKFSTVVAEDDEETNYRAWWIKPASNVFEVDPKDAIEAIKSYINDGKIIDKEPSGDQSQSDKGKFDTSEAGNIVGMIGFSQGAALAGLLARSFKDLFGIDTLEFVVLYSGFKLTDPKVAEYYKSTNDNFKMLHVCGELDTIVEEDRVMALYDIFDNVSDLLKHPGGHFVPNSKLYINQVVNWIQSPRITETNDKKEESLDDLTSMIDNLGKA